MTYPRDLEMGFGNAKEVFRITIPFATLGKIILLGTISSTKIAPGEGGFIASITAFVESTEPRHGSMGGYLYSEFFQTEEEAIMAITKHKERLHKSLNIALV